MRGGRPAAPLPEPGRTLRLAGPVSALPLSGGGPGARYAIWSATARRVRSLLGPGSAGSDELVFAPGTCFRVLEVRGGEPGPLVLLRELPSGERESPEQDRAVLDRLRAALDQDTPRANRPETWPDRCAGALGEH
ncbi:NAD(+)--protein-arginine ADP-ribosyltransferase OS=Streptomyces fumanus OX=67302 GN=GCM10018772_70050 PE=4 SV=1 [Streptomyces fumanus]